MDLGVTLDPDSSFDEYIINNSRAAFFHLRNIANMWQKLVHVFVPSRLDYCNALLSSYLDEALNKLQLVLNMADRILTRTIFLHPYYSSISLSMLATC
jgi:hypothetical protein